MIPFEPVIAVFAADDKTTALGTIALRANESIYELTLERHIATSLFSLELSMLNTMPIYARRTADSFTSIVILVRDNKNHTIVNKVVLNPSAADNTARSNKHFITLEGLTLTPIDRGNYKTMTVLTITANSSSTYVSPQTYVITLFNPPVCTPSQAPTPFITSLFPTL